MSDSLPARLRAKLALEERGKELVTEFRYACYPDADKDQLATLLAGYGCHGFESGLSVNFARLQPLHELLLAVVEAAEKSVERADDNADSFISRPIRDTLARLKEEVGE